MLLAIVDGRRRVPPRCGAMRRSVIVQDVCPGRIVVIHWKVFRLRGNYLPVYVMW